MLQVTTQKHLLKKTFNKKAHGIIEVVAKSDTKDIILYTWIKGDYDTLSDITYGKIKNAMEVMFDEKVKTYDNGKFDGKFGEYDGRGEE